MNRINLGQIPRNASGKISYQSIPSVIVKIMVAEAELEQLNRELNRHQSPGDTFLLSAC